MPKVKYCVTEFTPTANQVGMSHSFNAKVVINRIDSITIGRGCPEWGAPTDRDVFIIKHHKEPSPFVVGKNFKRYPILHSSLCK